MAVSIGSASGSASEGNLDPAPQQQEQARTNATEPLSAVDQNQAVHKQLAANSTGTVRSMVVC